MATTKNYGWTTPNDTDLVKDGAAAIRTLGSSVDTTTKALNPSTTLGDIEYRSATANTNTRLPIGTTGQILSVVAGVPSWVANDVGDITAVSAGTGISGGGTSGDITITNSMATAIDAKGDLIVGTGADTFSKLTAGTNTYILTADSAEATGLKWAAPAGGNYVLIGSTATFSASSAVNIDSKFSATYTNYKVIMQFTCSDNDTNVFIRLRASGTDTSTDYVNPTFRFTATGSASEEGGTSSWKIVSAGSTETNAADLTIYNPFAAKHTAFTTMGYGSYNPTTFSGYGNFAVGRQKSTTSFDGITILPSAGTITGTAQVYGLSI